MEDFNSPEDMGRLKISIENLNRKELGAPIIICDSDTEEKKEDYHYQNNATSKTPVVKVKSQRVKNPKKVDSNIEEKQREREKLEIRIQQYSQQCSMQKRNIPKTVLLVILAILTFFILVILGVVSVFFFLL